MPPEDARADGQQNSSSGLRPSLFNDDYFLQIFCITNYLSSKRGDNNRLANLSSSMRAPPIQVPNASSWLEVTQFKAQFGIASRQ